MYTSKRSRIQVPKRSIFTEVVNFDELWKILKSSINSIYLNETSQLSFEKLYHIVYLLILKKYGMNLYEKLKEYICEQLKKLKYVELEFKKIESQMFLERILKIWELQCNKMKLISDIMIYMDKFYCKMNGKLLVYDMGLDSFRTEIVVPLSDKLDQALLEEIKKARCKIQDRLSYPLLTKVIHMMKTLVNNGDSYLTTTFEPKFLKDTEIFYKEALRFSHNDAIMYIEKAKEWLDYEYHINKEFLEDDLCSKSRNIVKNVLVSEKMDDIIKDAMSIFINTNEFDKINLLYDLYNSNKQKVISQLGNCFLDDALNIKENELMKKKSLVAISYICSVIQLKNKYMDVISTLHDDSTASLRMLNECLSIFLDKNSRKFTEFIAIYIDHLLKSYKELNSELQKSLNDSICLIKLIKDKDLFEKLYQQQLAKRLLQRKSEPELEKYLISKLKEEIDILFIPKFEGMIRDIKTSYDCITNFISEQNIKKLNYDINVLTATFWPFQNIKRGCDVILPKSLEKLKLDFENYYLRSHSGRIINWEFNLSFVEIGFQFNTSYHELNMHIYAAAIFMLFETHSELTTQEIGILTNLPETELRQQLASLTFAPKTKILKKKKKSKIVEATDIFCINYSFTAPIRKIRILTPISDSNASLNTKSSQFMN